jgi:hypothetical protein
MADMIYGSCRGDLLGRSQTARKVDPVQPQGQRQRGSAALAARLRSGTAVAARDSCYGVEVESEGGWWSGCGAVRYDDPASNRYGGITLQSTEKVNTKKGERRNKERRLGV